MRHFQCKACRFPIVPVASARIIIDITITFTQIPDFIRPLKGRFRFGNHLLRGVRPPDIERRIPHRFKCTLQAVGSRLNRTHIVAQALCLLTKTVRRRIISCLQRPGFIPGTLQLRHISNLFRGNVVELLRHGNQTRGRIVRQFAECRRHLIDRHTRRIGKFRYRLTHLIEPGTGTHSGVDQLRQRAAGLVKRESRLLAGFRQHQHAV